MHLKPPSGLGCCLFEGSGPVIIDSLFIVAPIVRVLCLVLVLLCSVLLCVPPSFSIILMGKRELVALLCLSSWCLVTVIVLWLFLKVPWVGLQCVSVVFPDHIYFLFGHGVSDHLVNTEPSLTNYKWVRLAPVLKTVFHQCVISYTSSKSISDGSVLNRAIRVRLATSIHDSFMKNCLMD